MRGEADSSEKSWQQKKKVTFQGEREKLLTDKWTQNLWMMKYVIYLKMTKINKNIIVGGSGPKTVHIKC